MDYNNGTSETFGRIFPGKKRRDWRDRHGDFRSHLVHTFLFWDLGGFLSQKKLLWSKIVTNVTKQAVIIPLIDCLLNSLLSMGDLENVQQFWSFLRVWHSAKNIISNETIALFCHSDTSEKSFCLKMNWKESKYTKRSLSETGLWKAIFARESEVILEAKMCLWIGWMGRPFG